MEREEEKVELEVLLFFSPVHPLSLRSTQNKFSGEETEDRMLEWQ